MLIIDCILFLHLSILFSPESCMVFQQPTAVPPPPPEILKREAAQESEVTKQMANTSSAASPPKVDFATDLFNMLSMDDPSEGPSESANNDDNDWAGFQGILTAFTLL